MCARTVSEAIFEKFCSSNAIKWERIQEAEHSTPDYKVQLGGRDVFIEIKQIDEDANFRDSNGVSTRALGQHIRAKMAEGRRQVQFGARKDSPAILLIYNNLDPLQMFGTEQHDFLAGMYGDLTLSLVNGCVKDSFYGRNSMLRPGFNTSFAAVGHLVSTSGGIFVHIYENSYARLPLTYEELPACIQYNRVTIENDAS